MNSRGIFAFTLLLACGPSAGGDDGAGDGSTGSPSTGGETSTSRGSSSTAVATSAATDETGSSSSSAETTAASSSTGEPDVDPEPYCSGGGSACQRSCSVQSEIDFGETETGGVCECTSGLWAEDRIYCELPSVCEGKGHYCRVQALRYGIPGVLGFIAGGVDYVEQTVEILGDGRARALTFTQAHTCCSGSSVDTQNIEGYPIEVRAPDDPVWQECFATLPDVYGDDTIAECWQRPSFGTGVCHGPLEVCPDVQAHVPGCDAECPMANDGMCDEAIGTGLCADGRDPVDCTCAEDIEGQCDEVSEGGPCPLGSDADECPGLDPF